MSLFSRSSLLLGTAVVERLATTRVIIIGVGGVGSWCAESLVRTGVGHVTLVDSDRVATSNVNRQLMATTLTVGQLKVEALRRRLLEINPAADVVARPMVYDETTADEFDLASYDYVIDAIDSLKEKMLLIRRACLARPCTLFSSMGAALKIDPTRIRVAEFWKVAGDPLAAALRRRFKKSGDLPRRRFKCVFSDEVLKNEGAAPALSPDIPSHSPEALSPEVLSSEASPTSQWDARKAQINGSLVHITAVFGFTLASLVVQDVRQKVNTYCTAT